MLDGGDSYHGESCLTVKASGKVKTACFTRKTNECFKFFCSLPKQSKKYGDGIPNVLWKEVRNVFDILVTLFYLSSEFAQSMLLLNFA